MYVKQGLLLVASGIFMGDPSSEIRFKYSLNFSVCKLAVAGQSGVESRCFVISIFWSSGLNTWQKRLFIESTRLLSDSVGLHVQNILLYLPTSYDKARQMASTVVGCKKAELRIGYCTCQSIGIFVSLQSPLSGYGRPGRRRESVF